MILPKLGVDQSKDHFNVALLVPGEGDTKYRTRKFSNDASGFRALTRWLVDCGVVQVHFCAEATGRYGHNLAEFMVQEGHRVSIVNPRWIKHYRLGKGIRNKTDQGDPIVIADYARVFEPQEWVQPSKTMSEMRDSVGQMQLLKKHRTALANRQQCGLKSEYVIQSNQKMIADIDRQIRELEEHFMELLAKDSKLKRRFDILVSVPGIAKINAMCLVAQIDFDQFRNGRDLAVFLGLAPKLSQSGKTEDRSMVSKEGDVRLRALLRLGAVSAKRSQFYKPFVERLTGRGKSKGAVTNAVARKMILIAHACIREDALFNPNYIHPLLQTA